MVEDVIKNVIDKIYAVEERKCEKEHQKCQKGVLTLLKAKNM